MAPVEELMDAICHPYETRADLDRYALPAPAEFGPYRTFCGT
jgi:hypothetical protein